jgi:hypothetical protein
MSWTLAITLYLATSAAFTVFVLAIFHAGRDDDEYGGRE